MWPDIVMCAESDDCTMVLGILASGPGSLKANAKGTVAFFGSRKGTGGWVCEGSLRNSPSDAFGPSAEGADRGSLGHNDRQAISLTEKNHGHQEKGKRTGKEEREVRTPRELTAALSTNGPSRPRRHLCIVPLSQERPEAA